MRAAPGKATAAPVRPRAVRSAGAALLLLGLLAVTGCAGRAPLGSPIAPDDAALAADALRDATRLDGPLLIRFDWDVIEQGSRGSGEGVARVEPPYRARLDLFLRNGTTVARAALVDDQLLLPRGVPEGLIPPPGLLWAALGVFRPGADAELVAARRAGEVLELSYRLPDGRELRFRVDGERIAEAELLESGTVLHRVSLTAPAEPGLPDEATYRNLTAFRELKLLTRSIEHVESFPSDIWFPGR